MPPTLRLFCHAALLFPLVVPVASPAAEVVQTPTAPAPQTPASTPPAPRKASRPAGRPTLDVEVTDPGGSRLEGVVVDLTGPLERHGETADSGVIRFTNLRSGTYRLRFEHPGFVLLERELVLGAGARTVRVDVALSRHEPQAAVAPVAEAPPTPDPPRLVENRPVGEPRTEDVPAFVERNFIGRGEPQKVSVLGCTGYAATRVVQVREPFERRVNDEADESLYLIAGEATVRLGQRQFNIAPGVLVVIPRGTEYALSRRGRNPPVLLSVVSGPPCAGEDAVRQ